MPLSEVNRWKKKRQRKKEKEQRNDLQNYSERVRNTVLLFCLKKEKRKNLKNGHNKALLRIRKWEVGWWFSQHLRIWFFFLFTTECCKGVRHVTRKIRREKEAPSIIRENQKRCWPPYLEICYSRGKKTRL